MNQQRLAFAQAYLVSGIGTKAAIAAGYSERSAYSTAHRLLKDAEVQAYIEAQRREAAFRARLSLDSVIAEMRAIAFSDIRDVVAVRRGGVDLVESSLWKDDAAKAVESVAQTSSGIRIKMHDKLHALETLLGYLQENHQDDAEGLDALGKVNQIYSALMEPVEE